MSDNSVAAQTESVATSIRNYIAQNILFSENTYPHPDEASFLDEGIVDSMNLLGLVSFVEERFGIKVDDRDIVPDNFDSISRLAAYIAKMKAKT
jgi:acyl carrier protein